MLYVVLYSIGCRSLKSSQSYSPLALRLRGAILDRRGQFYRNGTVLHPTNRLPRMAQAMETNNTFQGMVAAAIKWMSLRRRNLD